MPPSWAIAAFAEPLPDCSRVAPLSHLLIVHRDGRLGPDETAVPGLAVAVELGLDVGAGFWGIRRRSLRADEQSERPLCA
jgi:hypothetical protein